MKLTIHRGTHEIGGSCVELCSNSGGIRLIIDIGMPLVTSDSLSFEWRRCKDLSQEQLLEQRVPPSILLFLPHHNNRCQCAEHDLLGNAAIGPAA